MGVYIRNKTRFRAEIRKCPILDPEGSTNTTVFVEPSGQKNIGNNFSKNWDDGANPTSIKFYWNGRRVYTISPGNFSLAGEIIFEIIDNKLSITINPSKKHRPIK
jgi:hypothetical protein